MGLPFFLQARPILRDLHKVLIALGKEEALAMSNPMKYIRDLEAAGFKRTQAEAQVQVVLDALEGELLTKADFAVFQEQVKNMFAQQEQRIENRLQLIDKRFVETEFRLVTRLGLIVVSTTTIAVAILTWLIKT